MKARVTGLAVALGLLIGIAPVSAHHPFAAEFDRNRPVQVTGVVSRVEWANPHAYLYLDTAGEKRGLDRTWKFELGGPNALERRGWYRSTVRAGDRVTVYGWRARNGRFYGSANNVKMEDGHDLNAASSYYDFGPRRTGYGR